LSEINPGTRTGLEIAVIGMAGRFPGAKNIQEFWENLKNGIETIIFFSDKELEALGAAHELTQDPNYVKAVSILDEVEYFDALFFGYAPIDAELMAPQTRVFHECTWHALEDAGYVPYTYNGSIGLYAGSSPSSQWEAVSFFSGKHAAAGEFGASLLADKDHMSTRISYNFNLKGPSFTVSTACSTSLVAIHLACQGLLSGECKMAAAGGVTVITPRGCGYLHQGEGTVLSPDGHCRSFDARSRGTVLGEGVGVVVLKSLEDALQDRDHIYAIIKGSAINNDGSGKVGYTAPGVKGQAAVIRAALHAAEVEPETIGYIEAHGTGTEMGDPIEMNALKLAFNTDRKAFCRIGSVKSNVGHLVYAAGVAGFIKLVLSLYHRLIPPSLFFETPNPAIDFENSPFVVNTCLTPWKTDGYPLRAGLNCFGLGGTNAHVVLEEVPQNGESNCRGGSLDPPLKSRDYQLIILSAKTPTALDEMTENLAEYLKNNLLNPGNHENPTNPGLVLADAAYTLQVGRMVFPYRRAVVCSDVDEAIAALSPQSGKTQSSHIKEEKRPIIFMFSGLGSQYVNMGLGLYQGEEVFRREIDRCSDILEPLLGCDVIEILYPADNFEEAEQHLDNMIYSGPIKFMFDYSLAKLLISWGICPGAMIGHSFGEYVAACLSGVFSLEDALKLVVLRGQLLEKAPEGAMLSVPLSEDQVKSLLQLKENKDLSLASVNSPSLCIVSGPTPALDRLEKELKEQGNEPVRINVNRAGHSKSMIPITREFREGLNRVTWHQPAIPYISGLTGTWIKEEEARDPGYWTSHLQETIQFSQGLQELLKKPAAIFVEISPGRGLTLFLNQHPAKKNSHLAIQMVRHRKENTPDLYYTLARVAEMWLYGAQVDWQGFYALQKRYRISLPLYPFQPQRYWLEGDISSMIKKGIPGQFSNQKRPNMADWFYTPSWKRSVIPGILSASRDKWLVFTGHGDFAAQLLKELMGHESENAVVIVKKGNEFKKEEKRLYTVNPAREKDYETLICELQAPGGPGIPDRVLHCWNLIEEDNQGRGYRCPSYQSAGQSLDLGFYSLLYLVRALAWQEYKGKIEITVLTDSMQEVWAEKVLHPEQAVVLGPVMVIPREFPDIECRCIDIDLADLEETKENEESRWLIDSLLKEFKTGIIDTLVAYRGRYRLVRTFEPVPLNPPESLTSRLRKQGVYLITGGLGGIGLVMARHLAETLQARLVLLGRSSFPARAEWEKWLKTHDHSDSISRKIHKVKELESLGAEVMISSVDVTDEQGMAAMVEKVQERFGTINGVIHTAGIPSGGLIQLKTREMADKVLDPKVKGTIVLDHVLQGIKLDFIMLCSSVNSVVPFLGQVDYFAANAFLDAFAFYKTSLDKTYTVSINWDSWQEVGRAVEAAKQLVSQNQALADAGYEDFLKEAILPAEGVEAFMRILAQSLPQVVVSTIDLPTRFAGSETLHASMADLGKEKEKETHGPHHPRPAISSSYIAPFTPAQQGLALIWQNILGIDRVGIDDDFFELGGDSLKATVVVSKIKKEMNTDISLKEIFITPRIRDLAKPLEISGTTPRTYNAVEPVEKKEYYPLTPMQKRLYILEQMEGIGTAYNQPYAWIIKREIDRQRLEQAFQLLITRHEILRTSFHMVDEKPVQKVHDQVDFKIEYYDMKEVEVKVKEESSSRFEGTRGLAPLSIAPLHIENFIRPFDLSSAPLLKVGLVKLTAGNHLLVFDIHHIAADGTSYVILLQDFITLYENQGKDLPGLRVWYKDFSVWLNSETWKAVDKKQEESWLKEFQGDIPRLDIFTDYPRPALQSFAGDRVAFELESPSTKALKELALAEGATLFMVVLALYTILLARLSGQEDIIVGTPVAARRHPDLEQIMGMFVNTLAIRNQPTREKSFKAFLSEVKKRTLEAFENQEYPFEELVEKVRVARDTGRNPLFDVMVTLDNYMPASIAIPAARQLNENREAWQPGENLFKNKISRFDITFDVYDRGENLVFTVDYCIKLFKKETIERLIGYFKTLVSSVLKDRHKEIPRIEILPDREKEKILYDFNDTRRPYPLNKTIQQLFAEQVQRSPGYIALIGPHELHESRPEGTRGLAPLSLLPLSLLPLSLPISITYRELDSKSNRWAGLLKEKGIQPDTIVAIMVERSIEMIIGILAILKAGGAYLPIDPASPGERIDFMLKDSNTQILVVDDISCASWLSFASKALLNLSEGHHLNFPASQLPSFPASLPSSLAYIIYTSGTTGQPKAVTVEHRNAVNTLLYRKEEYKMNSRNRALQLFSYAFDGFVTSFFTPVISGAAVVLLKQEEIKEIVKIKEAIVRHQVTHFISVPGLFRAIIENMSKQELCSLKVVTLAGDRLLPELLEIIKKKNKNMELAHEYGVTEAAVMNTIFRHQQKNPRVLIGKPIANTKIYILNQNRHLQPIGVPGELCIAGAGLARGYLNQPELTAISYLSYLYRTGDLARWLPDGNIEFLGRIDHQVKIRGYRIEPGEIENLLTKHKNIKQALVIPLTDDTGSKYLCAYIVTNLPLETAELRRYLSGNLPGYMIPWVFMRLEKIPLTPNGKVDRKALPEPRIDRKGQYMAPRNPIERKLVEIWSDVLNIDKNMIGIDADFFELGGHSLKAAILVSKIHKESNIKVPLVEILSRQTIRKLSVYLRDAVQSKYIGIEPVEKREYYTLSSAQKRLYFIQQMDLTSTAYNIPLVFPLGENLQKNRLEASLKQLIARHESLRTAFIQVNDTAVQRVHDSVEFKIEYYQVEERGQKTEDRRQMTEDRGQTTERKPANLSSVIRHLSSEIIRPFDLSRAPLIRSAVIKQVEGNYTWLVDIHHIVSDGTSHMILTDDFMSFYEDKSTGLERLKLQYKDFSQWQDHLFAGNEIKVQEYYWQHLYQDARGIPHMELPADYRRPEVFTYTGDLFRFKLESKDASAFNALGARNGATLYMNILAALNTLFYKYTSQTDIVIGTGIAGRHHADLLRIIGMFVNTLAIRNYPQAEKTYEAFLKEVVNQSVQAFENQDVQFEELVDRLDLERDPSRNPLFDIMMVVQNFKPHTRQLSDIENPGQIQTLPFTSKFDMTFFVYEETSAGEIFIDIEYYTAIFKKETMARLVRHFKKLIKEVITNPLVRLDDIDIIPAQEKQQLLVQFNDTRSAYPREKTIGELYEEQAAKTPDNIAIIGEGTRLVAPDPGRWPLHLTYRQLNDNSNQAANYLLSENGVVPGEPVGLLMDREVSMIIAIMGILKAGAGYVPLSPLFPEERMKTMIDDAGVRTLIGQKCFIKRLNRLQWECRGLDTFLCIDSAGIQAEDEEEQSQLMNRKLWEYVGETSVDEITGGGWNSSYTGNPIPKKEMDEYGDNILKKLQPLLHKNLRVLEIGAASGISMYRIAPKVGLYYGTDLSSATIEKNRERVKQEGHKNIKLARLAAHEIDQIEERDFDLVILNSVIQCFHGHNYLKKVIGKIIDMMENSGYIFIGDIMDQELKEDLIADLVKFKETHRDKNYKTKTDWSEELFISRSFLQDLRFEFPGISAVEFSSKIYTIENELTRYRYDALIIIDKTGITNHDETPPPETRKLIKSFCGGVQGGQFFQKAPPLIGCPRRGPAGGKNKHQHDLRTLKKYGTAKPAVEAKSANPAYVIYTSGSTGKPKGTLTTHYNVTRVVKNTNYIDLKPDDRILQLSDYAFDGSVFDIYGALLNGAALIMVKREKMLEIETLGHLIKKEKISVFFVTTALFNTLVDVGLESLSRVRKILFGGERVSTGHAGKALKYLGRGRILHVYGPTETTVYATYYPIDEIHDRQVTIPIGSPISNTSIYILDACFRLTALGISGEIYIGGTGAALGYLNNPELTAEKFCLRRARGAGTLLGGALFEKTAPPGPPRKNFSLEMPGSRLYRTGDLARWLPDGNIEFLGRIDYQVKIRGFRIELGEIERSLLKHNLIKETVVMDREDLNGQRYLCAYNVVEKTIDTSEIREFLGRTLPDYMIPSYFVQIHKMPLATTGKVDKKALPSPEITGREKYQPPRNQLEKKLIEIWSGVLYGTQLHSSIGLDDNFFELGGHSLKATTLTAKIHKELGIKVPLVEIFKSPTIRELSGYIKSAGAYRDRYTSIETVEKKDYYPLSSAQRRLFILQRMDIDNIGYNSSLVVLLEGELDEKRFEKIFTGLISRHESLRTSFQVKDEKPVQVVHAEVEFEIEYDRSLVNCQGRGEVSSPIRTETIIRKFIRPFNLSRAPLLRVGLIGLENNKYILIVDMHHIITDGTSHGIFIKEFTQLYAGKELLPLKLQYKDYALWQNSDKQRKILKAQEEYWTKQFAGDIPILNLPYDYPRPLVQDFAGETATFKIAGRETAALKALVLEGETTLYMLLLSIYNILLSKLSGQEDIIVGTPTAGRRHADQQHIVGMFVNTLALRNFPTGEKTFKEFLEELKQQTLEAFENQEYQFEDLVEKVDVERDASRNPLFDTMFALQNLEIPGLDIHGLKVKPYDYESTTARFDLTLQGYEVKKNLVFKLEYCTKLFRKETIQRFIEYFKGIIAAVLKDSAAQLSQIQILPEVEKKKILMDFNDTEIEYPGHKTLHQLFEEQAKRAPDRTALIGTAQEVRAEMRFEGTGGLAPLSALITITYNELNERSNQLARLLQERGVQPDTIAAIMVEPSLEMIIGIMGILKAGGAYLPIDPGYPEERIHYMLADSGAKILVTSSVLLEKFGKLLIVNCQLLIVNKMLPNSINNYQLTIDNLQLKQANLAYIIYTSGTTGRPKGVLVEHRSAVNILVALQRDYPLLESGAYLLKTAYLFDVSIAELFGWFWQGGRLVIMEPGDQKDPLKIIEAVKRYHITHIDFVPSVFAVFMEFLEHLEQGGIHGIKNLEHIFLAGEPLPAELVRRFQRLGTGIPLENLYGPTESTIYASRYSLSQWTGVGSVPIGKPLANIRLYILNQYHQFQPVGVPGELCISGIGLARGYLNRPGLTAEKFDHDLRDYQDYQDEKQKVPGERFYRSHTSHMSYITYKSYIYRTGDLARWLSDGNIEFLGRMDHQVKIRGFRIELGEIENRLLAHPGVQEAVVIDRTDTSGHKYLCAYIVPIGAVQVPKERDASMNMEVGELKEYLSRSLPAYMVPSYFVFLEILPLNPGGKVNRNALPGPGLLTGKVYAAPQDEIQHQLAGIWQELLDLPSPPGIDDRFFNLGGHSLKAMILAARIHQAFHVELPLSEIFNRTTIRKLSEFIRQAGKTMYVGIEPVEKKDYYPPSSAQKRVYFLQQMDPGSTGYNMPLVLPIGKNAEKNKLESVFKKLINRHESLRTSFHLVDEVLAQVVHAEVAFEIEYHQSLVREEKRSTSNCQGRGEVSSPIKIETIIREFVRPFDLSGAPLMRVGLIQEGKEAEYILMVDIHHIVSDGTSHMILAEEFASLYKGEELKPLGIQYKDFSAWQNCLIESGGIKAQEYYWLKLYTDAVEIPVLNLPADDKRPEIFTFAGAHYGFFLEREDALQFKAMGARYGATLYMNILAVLNTLFYKYTGRTDIIIGSGIAGRPHADIQQIIGMFVNTLAMRNHPHGEKTYEDLLKEVIANSVNAFENQDVQFEALVEKLGLPRDLSRNPLFDVTMVVQNFSQTEILAQWGETASNESWEEYKNFSSKFDLTFFVHEQGEDVFINLEYYTAIFKKETIRRLVSHFKNILGTIIDEPAVKLKDIDIISQEEKRLLLYEYNDTARGNTGNKSIQELFIEQVEKRPGYIAVVDVLQGAGTRLIASDLPGQIINVTYRELNEKSDRLAYVLIEKGILAEDIVGIMMEKSIEMLIGLLGILKTGGAYLPVDPDYPQERINYMLKDSGAKILLTRKEIAGLHSPIHPSTLLPFYPSQSSRLAYIIYTSGSSGKPKGVLVEHGGVVRLVKDTNFIRWKAGHRLLPTGSVVFDINTFETWGPLLNGVPLVLVDQSVILNDQAFEQVLHIHQVTHLHLIPQLFDHFAVRRPGIFKGLDYFLVGGDLVRPRYIDEIRRKYRDLKILHMYGPTENTTFSTFFEIKEEHSHALPIGKPVANSTVYILDHNHRLQPVGVYGELCTGGQGAARGYLNNPELTNQKFLRGESRCFTGAVFSKSAPPGRRRQKLYRTGDLARWNADGLLEFAGRMDFQVKIRGFRIETGEIENQLLGYHHIKETVPGPGIEMLSSDYMTPRNQVEEILVRIWADILGIDKGKIGIDANFFQLGGHSLKAAIMVSRMQKELNVKIPVAQIFKTPTIKALALEIQKADPVKFIEMEIVEKKEYYELSYNQKRLWIIYCMNPNSSSYHLPGLIRFDSGVDPVALKKALCVIFSRHESFRTGFKEVNGQPMQFIAANVEVPFDVLDISALPENEKQQRTSGMIDRTFNRPFDLSTPPLFRSILIKQGEGSFVFVYNMHHIVSDGWSMEVLKEEFKRWYDSYSKGKAPHPEPLRFRYQDFVQWHNRQIRALECREKAHRYWKKVMDSGFPNLKLPYYYNGSPGDRAGAAFRCVVDRDIKHKLLELAKHNNTTLFTVLFSIYSLLLAYLSGEEEIPVTIINAGREHPSLHMIVGYFINPVIVKTRVDLGGDFKDLLADVSKSVLEALQHQNYPIELAADELGIEFPGISTAFNLLNMQDISTGIELDSMESYHLEERQEVKFPLVLMLTEYRNGIEIGWEYQKSLFKPETIESVAEKYVQLMAEITGG
jgi:amino acid adenylation domain-containing protein